jgi:hypothetical protein
MQQLVELLAAHPDQVNAFAAVAALFVSLLSIVLTVASLWWQRQHNYFSVRPIGGIPIADYEDRIAVHIKNTGIGPLIIDKFRVSDGMTVETSLISLMPSLPQGMLWNTFLESLEGTCVPPGDRLKLLELSGDPSAQAFADARDDCRRRLSQLTVELWYKDIYGRRMPVAARSLDWFGRHFLTLDP